LTSPSVISSHRLNRIINIILAVIVTSLTIPAPLTGQDLRDLVRGLRRYIVRVSIGEGSGRSASGVVVTGAEQGVSVVTVLAAPPAALVIVEAVDGQRYLGRVIHRAGMGLTVVSVPNWIGPRVADLDTRPMVRDQSVVVLAFDPTTSGVVYTPVKALGPRRLGGRYPTGLLGGAVFSLAEFRVLGILTSPTGDVLPSSSIQAAVAASRAPRRPSPESPAPPVVISPAPPPPMAAPSPGAPGLLTFSVFPAGSAVSIDGVTLGKAPLSGGPFPPGTHTLAASMGGRVTVARKFTIPASASDVPLVLPLLPATEPSTTVGQDLLARAHQALGSGDPVLAVTLLRRLMIESPNVTQTRVYLGLALWLQGAHQEALEVLRGHVRLLGETPASLEAYVILGLLFEERQQYQEALTRFKLALRAQPAYTDAMQRANAATEAQIAEFRRHIADRPNDHLARIHLGLSLEAKGRFAESMKEFRTVVFSAPVDTITTVPPRPPARVIAIRSFPSRAFVFVGSRVVGQTPLNIPAIAEETVLRVRAPKYAEVGRRLSPGEPAAELVFVLPPSLQGLGRTPFAQERIKGALTSLAAGDGAGATRLLREALDSDYTLLILHIPIGISLAMQGRLSESLAALRGYLSRQSSGGAAVTAYAAMAVAWERQGNQREALTAYKLALRQHPAMSAVLGPPPITTDRGIEELERTARTRPNDPATLYRLGVAYEAKGRFPQGMAALRQALFLLGPP